MVKDTKRGFLSREARSQQILLARRQVREFLSPLEPLVRKMLVDRKSVTLEEWKQYWTEPNIRRELEVACDRYERLLIRIPDEWRRYCRQQFPGYKLFREYILLGRVPTGGAPRKPREEREDVRLARLVQDTTQTLACGWDLRRQRKAAGGFASGEEEIASELSNLGYERVQVQAILKHRTLHAAAVQVVAEQTGKSPKSVMVAASRTVSPAAPSDPKNPKKVR